MDLNVGNVQQSVDYSSKFNQDDLHKTQTEELHKSQKIAEDENTKKQQELTKEQLQDLTNELNKEMEPLNSDIKFSYNDKIHELVINVVDKNTDKVIRQIPSEEALKIKEQMKELVGALFDDKG